MTYHIYNEETEKVIIRGTVRPFDATENPNKRALDSYPNMDMKSINNDQIPNIAETLQDITKTKT